MCGIAGIVSANRSDRVEGEMLRRMCDIIAHRGPDDDGFRAKENVALGMRRLSIIDVAGGHQPISNEDGSVWIVFNGEIYNFLELRRDLEARGHRFATHTDTEAIVHLYEEYGSECVKKLRGMFAFAIHDTRNDELFMARDRLGKKPLHYAQAGDRLLFGSEIKSLLVADPKLAEINLEGLLNYLYFGYIPDPLTAFSRIFKLPPGHFLRFAKGKIHVEQYWDVPRYGTHEPASEEECLQELEATLADAVRMRLISEVPLGALLSGGVDSSTVVALMARASAKVKTFSIGFRNQDFNEAKYARQVAEVFGTEHHELTVDPNIEETLDLISRTMEEPFGDSSMIPTYYVSSLARQFVTVALAGDGGDELFAGYDRYRINLERARFDGFPQWLGGLYRDQVYPRLPSKVRGRKFVYNVSLSARERYMDCMAFFPASARERELFAPEFLRSVAGLPNPFRRFEKYYDDGPGTDSLSRLLYLDTKTYLPGDILTKVDRMSMATSLEVRAPLLDHVFVEQAARLPSKWKLANGEQKYILKRLAERVGVPREVIYRPKRGFAIPLVHWLRSELKGGLLELLTESRTLQRGYFEPAAVRSIIQEHTSGSRDRSSELWLMLVLELWHRNYLEATPQERSVACTNLLQNNRVAAGAVRA